MIDEFNVKTFLIEITKLESETFVFVCKNLKFVCFFSAGFTSLELW